MTPPLCMASSMWWGLVPNQRWLKISREWSRYYVRIIGKGTEASDCNFLAIWRPLPFCFLFLFSSLVNELSTFWVTVTPTTCSVKQVKGSSLLQRLCLFGTSHDRRSCRSPGSQRALGEIRKGWPRERSRRTAFDEYARVGLGLKKKATHCFTPRLVSAKKKPNNSPSQQYCNCVLAVLNEALGVVAKKTPAYWKSRRMLINVPYNGFSYMAICVNFKCSWRMSAVLQTFFRSSNCIWSGNVACAIRSFASVLFRKIHAYVRQ